MPASFVAATPAPTPNATAMPTPWPSPAETVNAFPTTHQELAVGRYDSSPPFKIPFTFEIPAAGWNTAHIHDDFLDVMRFDGQDPVAPTAWVAWAMPANIIGEETEPAAGLTPQQAAELMSNKPSVTAGNPVPFTFLARDGVEVELRADLPNTFIFGSGDSGDGNFGLDPAYPMRVGIVDHESGLLLVLCLAPDDDSTSGCGGEQQQIVESATE